MTFPTEWKVIIHSCSKPPIRYHIPSIPYIPSINPQSSTTRYIIYGNIIYIYTIYTKYTIINMGISYTIYIYGITDIPILIWSILPLCPSRNVPVFGLGGRSLKNTKRPAGRQRPAVGSTIITSAPPPSGKLLHNNGKTSIF